MAGESDVQGAAQGAPSLLQICLQAVAHNVLAGDTGIVRQLPEPELVHGVWRECVRLLRGSGVQGGRQHVLSVRSPRVQRHLAQAFAESWQPRCLLLKRTRSASLPSLLPVLGGQLQHLELACPRPFDLACVAVLPRLRCLSLRGCTWMTSNALATLVEPPPPPPRPPPLPPPLPPHTLPDAHAGGACCSSSGQVLQPQQQRQPHQLPQQQRPLPTPPPLACRRPGPRPPPPLAALDLTGLPLLDDTCARHIARLSSLQVLHCGNTGFGDGLLECLTYGRKLAQWVASQQPPSAHQQQQQQPPGKIGTAAAAAAATPPAGAGVAEVFGGAVGNLAAEWPPLGCLTSLRLNGTRVTERGVGLLGCWLDRLEFLDVRYTGIPLRSLVQLQRRFGLRPVQGGVLTRSAGLADRAVNRNEVACCCGSTGGGSGGGGSGGSTGSLDLEGWAVQGVTLLLEEGEEEEGCGHRQQGQGGGYQRQEEYYQQAHGPAVWRGPPT